MASPLLVTLTDANYQKEVEQSAIPVLVDLWAEWCGPCKMLGPVLEELAGEYTGKVKITKLNIDEYGQAAAQLAAPMPITSIPMLLLFKGGKQAGMIMGYKAKPALKAALDNLLA